VTSGKGERGYAETRPRRRLCARRNILGFAGLALAGLALASVPASAETFRALGSVTSPAQYVGDGVGTTFRVAVDNTNASLSVGAVSVSAPTGWRIVACPAAPLGWSRSLTAGECRFASPPGSAGDLRPRTTSSSFRVTATTRSSATDLVGRWTVRAYRASGFTGPSATASPGASSMVTHAYSLQVRRVLVATAPVPGAVCPAAASTGQEGSLTTLVVCAVNRSTAALTPVFDHSRLSGTFASGGTYRSSRASAGPATPFLSSWRDSTILSAGTGKTVVVRLGTATGQSSPMTTFDGFTSTAPPAPPPPSVNHAPVARDDAAGVQSDATTTIAVLANDTDADGDALHVASVDTTGTVGAVTANADGTVTYDPRGRFTTLSPGAKTTDSFRYRAADAAAESQPALVTVTVTAPASPPGPVNQPPTVVTDTGSASYTENAAAVTVSPGLTVADIDSANLQSATVAVGTGFRTGQDVLAFVNTAAITGAYNGASGVLTLTGAAPVADYQTALRAVTFEAGGDNPGSATRSIQFRVSDGAASSAVASRDVTVTPINDSPVVSMTGAPLPYTEGGSPVVDSGLTVADLDSATLSGATMAVTGNFSAADGDTLNFVNTANIVGSYNSGTGVLTLSGADTVAAYQAALRSVVFTLTSDNPSTATRTVSLLVNDGTDPSNTATRDITVAAADDPPVVSTTAGSTGYTENAAATAIDASLTVVDVDDTNLESGQVRISSGLGAGDELVFVAQNGISGSYNAGTGVLTLTGPSSVSNYQTALRSIQYQTTSDSPATSKTVVFKVNDGDADSNLATKTVAITPVNDAPVNTVPGAQSTLEDSPLVLSAGAGNPLSVTDLDAASGQVSLLLSVTHGTLLVASTSGLSPSSQPAAATLSFSGTLTAVNSALNGLTYLPDADYNGPDSLAIQSDDNGNTGSGGGLTDTDAAALTVTPVNDAPSFSLPASPNQSLLEDAGAQSVSAFATGMSAGPADEAGQALNFLVTNDNSALFSAQPSVNATTGDLTFTPAANANGSAVVTVKLHDNGGTSGGGSDTSAPKTFMVAVTAVNDAPSFTLPASPNQSVNENAAAQTVSAFATNASAGPADEASQSLAFQLTNDNNSLFSTQPAINASSGDLTYTPAAGQLGTAIVTVTLGDDGGTANGGVDTSSPQTFTITVHPPNFPATNVTLTPSSIAENNAPGAPVGTLSNDDPDVGDTFTYSLVSGTGSTDNSAFAICGASNDQICAQSTLDFETKNSYSIRIQVADNHGNAFAKALTVTVSNVNEPATDLGLSPNSIAENAGADAVVGTLTPTDPDTGETYSYALVAGTGSTDNGSFNISGSSLRENASFDFETKSSYSVRVQVTDGPNSFQKAFTVTVSDLNEAPTDLILSPSAIAENAGANAVVGTLSPTDPDTGETYSYALVSGTGSTDNGSFNIAGSSLRENGSFDFETKSSYSVRVQVTDGPNTFQKALTVTVTNVNEAPTDISLTNNNIDENKPSASAVGTLAPVGDPDSGETYTFTLLTSGCSGSFPDSSSFQVSGSALQSAVSFNYEVKSSYSICVRVNDPGSPNLSFEKSMSIAINDVNDAPVDGNESANGVGNTLLEYGSVTSPSSAPKKVLSGNLLANATDEDQPPQTLTISAADTTSAQGGNVAVSSSGAFSYVPAAGYTGSDTFNYTVSDGNGGTDTSTVTITVASRVWFVKNNAIAGGTGRSTDPFDTLAEADSAANATGDITYVYKGDGTTTGLTGGFALLTNQKLLGEPVNLVVGADTLATGTPANRPALSGTVALASGSRVEAVDIGGSGGAALAGTNTGGSDVTNVNLSGGAGGVALTGAAGGTFNFTNFTINTTGGTGLLVNSSGSPTINVGSGSTENVSATGGPAVDVRNANTASSLTFDAASSTNSSGAGINLDANGATTFSASSGSISGAAGNAIDVNGGSGNITYPGTLGNGAGNTADITGRTGGSISLSGDINDTNDAGGGITMSGNTGGSTTFSGSTKTLNTGASAAFSSTGSGQTITFSNGGLNIDTTSGAGFAATGGGTINVTGPVNTIDSTTGTALNVANTTIGASGLNFQSISANGAVNGIVLSSTGASGSLTVAGTGVAGSGGTLQNLTNYGISLASTQTPSFTDMTIQNVARNGIDGTGVAGFTFTNGTISNAGTAAAGQYEENLISFNDGGFFTTDTLDGLVTITGNTFNQPHRTGIQIETGSGTISNLVISNNTFTGGTTTGSILHAIEVLTQGSASTTANLTTGKIQNNQISGFENLSGSPAIFTGGSGIFLGGGSGNGSNNTSSTLGTAANPIEISGNDVDNVGSNGIQVSFNGQQGISNFNIHDNGTAADPMSNMEGLGISVFFGGSGTFSAVVNNNAMDNNGPTVNAGSAGIGVQLDDGPAGLANATGFATITVNGNRITNPDGFGIRGIDRASNGTLRLKVQNNVVGTPSAVNREAIRIDSGSTAGDTTLCLNMTGNAGSSGNLTGSGVDAGIGVRKQGTVAATNDFGIVGIASPAGTVVTNAQVQAFLGNPLNATNDGSGGSANGVDIISGSNYTSCASF
jgi:VCBS repeat-containing protein